MADDSQQVGQDEIEQLLRQAQDAGGATPAPEAEAETPSPEEASSPVADASVDQAEIERLLGQGAGGTQAPAASAASSSPAGLAATPTAQAAGDPAVSQNDVELLLNKAEQALASIDQTSDALPPGVQTFEFQHFSGSAANSESATLELMRDVQLDMTIELGRTHMHLEDVLQLRQGSVVPLNKQAGDPADIYVNGRLVARGEVLVLNDNFCIRVAELVVGDSACA